MPAVADVVPAGGWKRAAHATELDSQVGSVPAGAARGAVEREERATAVHRGSLSVKRPALSRRGCARSGRGELVHVVVETGPAQVQQQLRLPCAGQVQAHVRDAVEIARHLDAVLVEHAHAPRRRAPRRGSPSRRRLPGARASRSTAPSSDSRRGAADVVCRQQHDRVVRPRRVLRAAARSASRVRSRARLTILISCSPACSSRCSTACFQLLVAPVREIHLARSRRRRRFARLALGRRRRLRVLRQLASRLLWHARAPRRPPGAPAAAARPATRRGRRSAGLRSRTTGSSLALARSVRRACSRELS